LKTLLANGCSHTSGAECNTNYAEILAESWGYDLINLGTPAAGNHRVMRTTIEYCEQHHVDFVVIGWSTYERMEIPWKGDFIHYGMTTPPRIEAERQLFKLLDLYAMDFNTGKTFTLVYQLALQTYLQQKNIPYIFMSAFNCWKDFKYQDMEASIDISRFHRPEVSIIQEYMSKYPDHFTKNSHGNAFIHGLIAAELEQYKPKDVEDLTESEEALRKAKIEKLRKHDPFIYD
jgi:hypothetical protein